MTYQSEPTRWTESPGDAPELLRSAIRACADEGPSDSQMRSLALKLAVVGGGAAVIASAASAAASASAAGAGVASAGSLAASGGSALTFAKVAAVSVALIGAAATGAVLVRRDAAPTQVVRHRAPIAAPVTSSAADDAQAPGVEPRIAAAAVERAPSAPAEREVPVAPAPAPALHPTHAEQPRASTSQPASATSTTVNEAKASDARATKRAERREARHQARLSARAATHTRASEAADSQVELPRELPRSARGASNGELELLHQARAALSVRPLSAFTLTQEHRSKYPDGVFTQERDAIAVEALLRAGDLGRAKSLAERFIDKYPSSPHAHRFRETMKLQ